MDYPTIIRDDRSGERLIRFVSFKKIGQLRLDSNFRPVADITTSEECAETLRDFLARWRDRTERIVLQASARNLARVGRLREAINPISVIVYNLLTKNEITFAEIAEFRRPEKTKQYLSLLEQNEIVQKTNTGYTYGNAFTSIVKQVKEKAVKGFENEEEAVMAYIIEQNYSVLREVFRISRLEPFVHMDTCYYQPALQAGQLIYQKEKSLTTRYNSTYPPIAPGELGPVINELVRVDTLRREGPYLVGVPDLFARMQRIQTELPEFASLIA